MIGMCKVYMFLFMFLLIIDLLHQMHIAVIILFSGLQPQKVENLH